jgi:hypothetical protein
MRAFRKQFAKFGIRSRLFVWCMALTSQCLAKRKQNCNTLRRQPNAIVFQKSGNAFPHFSFLTTHVTFLTMKLFTSLVILVSLSCAAFARLVEPEADIAETTTDMDAENDRTLYHWKAPKCK